MENSEFHKRARTLFDKISKHGNVHGNKFTMMSKPDEEVLRLIEDELRASKAEA